MPALTRRALRDISNQIKPTEQSYAGKLQITAKEDVAKPTEQPTYAGKLRIIANEDVAKALDDAISALDNIDLTDAQPIGDQVNQSHKKDEQPKFGRMLQELNGAFDALQLEGLADLSQKVHHTKKELGSGKSGTVFQASLDAGSMVAIKSFVLNEKSKEASSEESEEDSFREQVGFMVEEAKMGFMACSRGRTGKKSNICKTLGVLRSGIDLHGKMRAAIVMEKAPGTDLLDFMAQRQFWARAASVQQGGYFIRQEDDGTLLEFTMSREQKLMIAAELTAAVVEAHSNGVLHCDIKPENTMIDLRDHPTTARPAVDLRLIDFGLSVRVGCAEAISAGTPGYEAPEAEAFGEVSEQSDVYSLGRALAELWTGSAIGEHDEEQSQAISDAVAGITAARVCKALEYLHWEGEHAKDVEMLLLHDVQVGLLLARCLAEQPEHRPTPRLLLKRLRKLLAQQRAAEPRSSVE